MLRCLVWGALIVALGCGTSSAPSGSTSSPQGSGNAGGSDNGGSGGLGSAGLGNGGSGEGGSGTGGLLGGIVGGVAGVGGTLQGEAGMGNDAGVAPPASDNLNVGDAPRWVEYIRATNFERLLFEVDSVEGMEPRANVMTRIEQRFAEIVDKPAGVEMVNDDVIEPRGSDFAWDNDDLAEVALLYDGDPDDDTLSIHVTYVDGHSAGDDDGAVILGVAWGNFQIVMFKQTIEDSCGGFALLGREQACEEAEFGILSHEIGHVLGLVNNGLVMQTDHQDVEHGAHDVNEGCIMYWAYEGQGLFDSIGARLLANDDTSLSFCQQCLDDIAAVK